MLNKKVEEALNEQIKLEEESSRVYMAMASWCESNGFPGAAQFYTSTPTRNACIRQSSFIT